MIIIWTICVFRNTVATRSYGGIKETNKLSHVTAPPVEESLPFDPRERPEREWPPFTDFELSDVLTGTML